MYNIIIDNIQDKYDYNELIKIIFKWPEDYRLFAGQEYEGPSSEEDTLIEFNSEGFKDKESDKARDISGTKPDHQNFSSLGNTHRSKAGETDERAFREIRFF